MSDRLPDWKKLGDAIEPAWTPQRAVEIERRIALRRQEWRRRRTVFSVAAAFTLLILATAFFLRFPSEDIEVSTKNPSDGDIAFLAAEETVAQRDEASQVAVKIADMPPLATAVSEDARFEMKEEVATRTYRIISGAVRFDSGKKSKKSLKVKAGVVEIEDIGTVFTVEALPDGRARVDVLEGLVLVTWPQGSAKLGAGKKEMFPPGKHRIAKDEGAAKPASRLSSSAAQDWRPYARRGDYGLAFQIIEASPSSVDNRVADLLLAADVMRLSGRPKQAIVYLVKILKEHKADPRADLAAFTAGRVFLDELGSPEKAAHAFAKAAQKGSPLAEEASAREVEAWSRAGEVDRARAAAERFIQRYPGSARVSVVRAFGGLSSTLK